MVGRPQGESRARAAVLERPSGAAACACTVCVLLVCALFLLWTAATASAAAGGLDWAKTWNAGRPGIVSTAECAAKPGGGVYVAASLLRPSGNIDIVVLRYSASGSRRWTRSYDGPSHGLDWVTGIAVDRQGNVVVCGSSFGASGRDDWVVLKYGPDGTRRWVKKFAGSYGHSDVPEAIGVDAKGGVVVAGTLTRRATGGDWCVIKYGAGGALLWRTTMTRSVAGLDQPLALAVDPSDSNVYVTGRMYGSQTGDDAVTVRYRADGRRVWRQRWDGAASGPDHCVAIALSPAGIAVAGASGSPASGDDGLVLRYAKNGSLRWAKVVDGGQGAGGADRFAAVGIDSGGGVVAAGSVTTSPAQGADLALVRYANGGAEVARWVLDGAGADEAAYDLAVTATGRAYAAGTSAGATGPDAVVAGLSGGLTPLWPAIWYDRAGGGDQAQSISLGSGAAYATGVSGTDLLVLKISR